MSEPTGEARRPVVLRGGTVLTLDGAHTVLAGRRTVEATVDHLRGTLGEEAWAQGMNPDVPATKVLDNPYTYTDYRSASTHQVR
jgi:hypothetical protein